MVEPRKPSLAQVRDLASSLANGYPIAPSIYENNPWIRDYSQEVVREIYGDHFPAWNFQTLGVFAAPWDAPVQTVTTNPRRLWISMAFHPTFDWGLNHFQKIVSQEQIVFRYELTPERVLVYVPALIQAILDMFGDSLKRWKTSNGKSLRMVLQRSLEHEDEQIVADLSGLEPSVMDFRIGKKQWQPKPHQPHVPSGVLEWRPPVEEEPDLVEKPGEIWWWRKRLVWDLVRELDQESPEAYAEQMIRNDQVALDDEWTRERVVDYFRDVYRKIGEFFAP